MDKGGQEVQTSSDKINSIGCNVQHHGFGWHYRMADLKDAKKIDINGLITKMKKHVFLLFFLSK